MTAAARRSWGLAAAALVLAAAAILLWGYVTDDTFIHLRYARHLVERGELSFNPGEPTYGATSPLWVFALGLLLKLGLAPLAAARTLGLAAAALLLLAADRLAARLPAPVPAGWRPWLVLLVAADAWFLRWSLSGMETPLAGLLLLLLLAPAVRRPGPAADPAPWLAWGAAAGLACLVRPEFALLAAGAAPWLLWARRREGPGWGRAALGMAAGGAVVLLPWLAYAWRVFGRLTPETAAAKSYAPTLDPAQVLDSLLRSVRQLAAVQAPLWIALVLLALLALPLLRRGTATVAPGPDAAARARRAALVGVPLTWVVLLTGGYAVNRVWVISRYLSPLLPALLLAGAVPAAALRDRLAAAGPVRRRAGRLALAAGVAAALLLNGWLTAGPVRAHADGFGRGVRECFAGTGEWLRANTPPEATVAALDIGAIGFVGERRILDLAGLVSPEILALGRERGFAAMVESGVWLEAVRPDYVFDRTDGPPRWDGRAWHGVRFELIDSCVVEGIGLREAQPWTYALYRVLDAGGGPLPGDPSPAPPDSAGRD